MRPPCGARGFKYSFLQPLVSGFHANEARPGTRSDSKTWFASHTFPASSSANVVTCEYANNIFLDWGYSDGFSANSHSIGDGWSLLGSGSVSPCCRHFFKSPMGSSWRGLSDQSIVSIASFFGLLSQSVPDAEISPVVITRIRKSTGDPKDSLDLGPLAEPPK
jgi:hypothetical protein